MISCQIPAASGRGGDEAVSPAHFLLVRFRTSSSGMGSHPTVIARFRTVNAILEQARLCRPIRKVDLGRGTVRLFELARPSLHDIFVRIAGAES